MGRALGLMICAVVMAGLGFFGGWSVGGRDEDDDRAGSAGGLVREVDESSAGASERELRQRLEDARRRERELRATIAELRGTNSTEAGDDGEPAAADEARESAGSGVTFGGPRDETREQLLARGDMEGLSLLAAELLQQGEPGYEKLVEMSTWLEEQGESLQHMERFWRDEEVFIGSLLRVAGDNIEDILRFGIYLDGVDEESMPGLLGKLHREMSDELGAVLLGYYDGEDAELLDAYVEKYKHELEEDGFAHHDAEERVLALGQIRTEASTQLLLDLLDRVPTTLLGDVVRALAWQRSSEALPALEDLRASTGDDELIPVIDAAIEYLK